MTTKAIIQITAKDNTRAAFARVSQSLRTMRGGVTGLIGSLGTLKSLLPALGLALMVKQSIQAAEALRGMDARVRRATEALGDYNRVQKELYDLSQRNGTALVETANLFISINRAAQDLGKGRDEVLQLTDTIQQLGVISGASDEQMKNSLRQFSQAMAGGVVRAEEFNSIIENTPEIANRMAQGLGMTVGQLRLAVVEGKVLSKDVFDSLLGQSEAIRADFEKMPLTIGRAWQSLKNAMSRFIADANEAGGVTAGIADKIKIVANAIDDLNRRVASGELRAEFILWIELMSDVGAQVDWLKSKFAELTPSGSGIDFAWSDFFKDLPALLHLSFAELFGIVDRGIITIAQTWEQLPFLWDKVWLNITTKAREWWAQITGIFSSDASLADAIREIEAGYTQAVGPIDASLRAIEERHEAARKASMDAVAAIREEQFARMDQRRALVEVNRALEDFISTNDELFGFQRQVIASTKDQAAATDDVGESLKTAAASGRDYYKSMFDVTTLNLKKSFEESAKAAKDTTEAIEETTDSIFDMGEAMKQVQNNIQEGFSDLFFDLFSGKGVDSFKDFANRVLDIFKRLLADMAAAWAATKIFKFFGMEVGGVSFGGGGGGSVAGAVINKGITAAIEKSGIGKAISAGISKGLTGIKGLFGGGAAGNGFGGGLSGGGGFATQASSGSAASSGAGWGGAAVPLAIAAYGFSAQAKKQQQRMALQNQFMTQVGTGTSEALGSGIDFRGMLNDAEAFFSTTRAGWQSTIEALNQAGVATKGWGAMLDENGRGLIKIQGDIEGVKRGLDGAAAVGFSFGSSLEAAIEKGQNMRVSIQGDADAIGAALNAATAMGIGGFSNLESKGNTTTAILTGNIALWDTYLQGFVNESIRAAVSGVGALGNQASSATGQFLELARAAASVKVGASISGGRAIQDAGFADGGIATGPRSGYTATLHGTEAIIPLKNGPVPVVVTGGGQSSDETNKLLREQNRLLRQSLRQAERAV